MRLLTAWFSWLCRTNDGLSAVLFGRRALAQFNPMKSVKIIAWQPGYLSFSVIHSGRRYAYTGAVPAVLGPCPGAVARLKSVIFSLSMPSQVT